ncbi:hypothetical protein MRB53_003452 [Persea americana]|uniref:Uncharacterized protein n=1 Tax=Persea americana TaxID=3435 RepID=A0ACC2MZ20_PERAE|nr:hypothetical protein MRB53_003452 [Persea americana]
MRDPAATVILFRHETGRVYDTLRAADRTTHHKYTVGPTSTTSSSSCSISPSQRRSSRSPGSSPTAFLLSSIELSHLYTPSLVEVSLSVLPASCASSLSISRCSPDLVELFCPRCCSFLSR